MNDSETGNDSSIDSDRHPVDVLAEEFADRIRAGENPSIDEYASRHPEHADMIRSVFPSIAMVQRVSNRAEQRLKSDSQRSLAFSGHQVPEILGDFRILREVGRGGMGVVYEAVQLSLKRHVALKVIGAIPSGSDRQMTRFRREAEAAASLHHTHIVPVFGIGEEQGVQYYAMQLIDGVSLNEVIRFLQGDKSASSNTADRSMSQATFSTAKAVEFLLHRSASSDLSLSMFESDDEVSPRSPEKRSPPAPDMNPTLAFDRESIELEEMKPGQEKKPRSMGMAYYRNVARIIEHVADGLQYAHHQGVLHRDIKPGNLLLDRDGIVWITDFGLARRTEWDDMTQTGEIVGTLRYMAPEQMRGEADRRTDVYSLGLTLFELLTLQPAIEQPQNRLYQSDTLDVASKMKAFKSAIPSDLQTIALKACAVEAQHRYQTAGEFEDDLRRFLEDRPILARRATQAERLYRWARRNPTIAGLSSATLLLLLTIAGLLAIFNQRKQVALNAIQAQFNRAEQNVREKTEALAAVEKERTRAELNLDLAIEAFDAVIDNIANRGASDSILNELNEEADIGGMADATLSGADVILLETLLEFFDRFSAKNETDLSGKSADARQRVAYIQHRLGRLDDAENSYQLALNALLSKAKNQKDDPATVYMQADILNELLVIAAKRGQMPKAVEYYEQARKILEQPGPIRSSKEGRFALAKTHNNLASIGYRFARGPGPRSRPPIVTRFVKPNEDSPPGMQRNWMQREATVNGEALEILSDLTAESPETTSYQLAFAQSLRDEFRIARVMNDGKRADDSLLKAIGILEQLSKQFPESDAYKYELALTLSVGGPMIRPNEMPRFLRSMKLCDELIAKHPHVAEYRTLRGQALDRMAMMHWSARRTERAEDSFREALDIQKKLADQFPDVLLYQLSLFQTLQHIIEFHLDINRLDLAKEDLKSAISQFENYRGQNRFPEGLQPLINRMLERLKMLENPN